MKSNPLFRTLISRVTDRIAKNQDIDLTEKKTRPLVVETLEPRILFSGSPTPAPEPAPEATPASQEAPAPAPETAEATPAEDEATVATTPEGESAPAEATDGTTAIALTSEQVSALAEAATQRWVDSGISDEQTAKLHSASYEIADLGGRSLGSAEGNTITLDIDAAGHGWFVDSTPFADEEFSSDGVSIHSDSSSDADGKFDLLTAILHEQGHILGLDDADGESDALMHAFLGAGERRLPASGVADGAVSDDSNVHFLTAVVDTLPANNQANLSADAGQTFTVNSAIVQRLGSIIVKGPSNGSPGTAYTLEVWTDADGDHSTWGTGTLVATSTNSETLPNGSTVLYNFSGELLQPGNVYGFTFTDGAGNRIDARPGLTNADAIADGTLFNVGGQVFGDAFDIAMQVNTTDNTLVLLDHVNLPNLVTVGSQASFAVQTFSPGTGGVGTADTVAALAPVVELDNVSFVRAPSGTATAGALYVNVYSGGNGDTGTFLGASTNAVDVNNSEALSLMTWNFAALTLNSTDTYSLVFSTTNTAGGTVLARLAAANNGAGFGNTYNGGVADDSGNAGSPVPFDTRFSAAFKAVPSTVYVEDTTWSGLAAGSVIADADFGTAGSQQAIFGVNAFSTINDALTAAGSGGTVIVNDGTYGEAVSLGRGLTLEITGPTVTIDSLDSTVGTYVNIEGGSTLIIGDATDTTLAGAIVGSGSLTKVGAGNVTMVEGGGTFNTALANTYVSTAAATTIIPGLTVADVTGVGAAIMNGDSIRANKPATGYNFTNNGTTATFDLAFYDGTFTKANKVELTNSGGGVAARVLAARYWNGDVLSPTFNFNTAGFNNANVATSDTTNGYGTKSLDLVNSVTFNSGRDDLFVSPNPGTTILPGATVASITGVTSALMNGAFISPKNVAASAYNFTNDGTTASFTVAIFQGGFTKTNHIELTNSSGGIVAQVVGAKYWTGNVLGSGFDFFTTPGATNTSVATSDTAGGYGTKSLNLAKAAGNAAFTGDTTVTSGTLTVTYSEALGSGDLIMDGGTLNTNVDLANDITLNNAANTIAANGNYRVLSGQISGAGGFTLANGGGTAGLALSNSANDFAGDITINSGTFLRLDADEVIPDTASVNAIGSLRFEGDGRMETISGLDGGGRIFAVNSGGGATLTVGSGNASGSHTGQIGGGGANNKNISFVKIGTGTQTLGGSSSDFTGGTLIDDGRLSVTNSNGLGTGTVTIDGGILRTSVNLANDITLNNASNTIEANGNYHQLNGQISGVGGFTLANGGGVAGLQVTNSANDFAGDVTINSGTYLRLTQSEVITDTANVVNNGNLRLDVVGGGTETISGLSGTGSVWIPTDNSTVQTLVVGANDATSTYAGTIGQTGQNNAFLALEKIGNGTQTLSGNNAYTGGTTISQGTLVGSTNSAFGGGTITLNDANTAANDTALFLAGTADIANNIVVANLGSGTVTVGANGTGSSNNIFSGSVQLDRATTLTGDQDRTSFTNVISGNVGTITIARSPDLGGGGRVTFEQNNTFVGDVDIESGTLQVGGGGGANQIPDASNVNVQADGRFNLVFDNEAINGLTGSGVVSFFPSGGLGATTLTVGAGDNPSADFGGTIQDAGGTAMNLIKTGTGTQTLSGANTYSGGTTLSQGILRTTNSSGFGTNAVTMGDANTGTDDIQLGLAANNIGNAIVVSNNGTGEATIFGESPFNAHTGTITLDRDATLEIPVNGTSDWWYAFGGGGISGPAGLVIKGGGGGTSAAAGGNRVVLAGSNNFSGGTVIESGQLQINSLNGAGTGTVTLGNTNSGTAVTQLRVGQNIANNIIVSSAAPATAAASIGTYNALQTLGGELQVDRDVTINGAGDRLTWSGGGAVWSGAGDITVSGGRVTHDGATNTWTGDLTINGSSTFQPGSTTSLTSANSVTANGTLQLNNVDQTIDGLSGSGVVKNIIGGNTLTVGAAGASTTFSGMLDNGSGPLSIIKEGTGTFTLTGGTNTIFDVTADGGVLSFEGNSVTNIGRYLRVGDTVTGNVEVKDSAQVTVTDELLVGDSGGVSGNVNQTGGTLTVNNRVRLAHWGGEVSTYDISAGTLNVTNSLNVGWDGIGVFTQSGGTVNTGSVNLDANPLDSPIGGQNDELNLSGGQFNTNFFGDGGGISNISGTADVNINGNLFLGEGGGRPGAINQTGGTVDVSGQIRVAHFSGETSTYDLSAGTLNSNGTLYVGWDGVGDMNVSGTGDLNAGTIIVQRNSDLSIADSGTVDTTFLSIGDQRGTGFVTQTGGTVTANGEIRVGHWGAGANSQYNISGGLLDANGELSVGWDGANAAMNVTGSGTVDAGTVRVQRAANLNIGDTSTFNASQLRVGEGARGTGTVTIDGTGDTNVAGSVIIQQNSTLNVDGSSTLDANFFSIGDQAGAGFVTQTGGTVTANGEIRIAHWGAGANSQYNISGGVLNSGSLTVGWDGTNGAMNVTGTSDVNVSGTVIVQRAADLNFDDTSTFDAANLSMGDQRGTGTITQDGGAVTFTNQFRIGHWNTGSSTYFMNAGTLDLTGTSGGGGEQPGILTLGVDGTGNFVQTGGDVTAEGVVLDARGDTSSGIDTLTVNGGTMTLGQHGIASANPSIQVNLGGGTLAASAAWGSTLDMSVTGSGGPINFDTNGFDIAAAGVLSGPGGLEKNGAGNLILNGANTFAGVTNVNAGTLAGTGGVGGPLVIVSGSTYDPGADPAGNTTAQFETGGFIGTAGADFNVDLNSGTAGIGYDQTVVSGDVNLGDITLNLMGGFDPTAGDMIRLIDNLGANPVSGTFAGLAEGAIIDDIGNQNVYTITYLGGDGNDVVLLSQGPAETGGSIDGGNLVVEDIGDTSTDDRLTVTVVKDSLGNDAIQISDPNQVLGVDFATGVTRPDIHTIIVPLDAFDNLIIRTNDGLDIINIADLTGFDQSLTVDGGGIDGEIDYIDYSANALVADGETYDFDAERILLDLDSSISAADPGADAITIDLAASGGSGDFAGLNLRRASLSSGGGGITLTGVGGDTGNTNDGVVLTHGSMVSTGGGSVTITGTATSTTGANDGIGLKGGSDITAGGAGGITLAGTSSGVNSSYGVQLFSGTEVTTAGGDIAITGASTAGGSRNAGIYTNGATVTAGGAGSVTMTGTGGGAGSNNNGLSLAATAVDAGTSGDVTLVGMGGGGTSGNGGVQVGTRTSVSAGGGNVTITGTGGAGTGVRNTGVSLLSGSSVSSGGDTSITGVAGTGTSRNGGVSLVSSTVTAAGDLTVDGTGNGTGSNNSGISSSRSTLGGAEVTLAGTGSTSSSTGRFNDGVSISRGGVTASGTLTIDAAGGTGSRDNRGLFVSRAALGGTLAVTGSADTGSGARSTGVFIQNSVLSDDGTIAGTGGGVDGADGFGVYMRNITGGANLGVTTAPDTDEEKGGNYFDAVLPAMLVLGAGASNGRKRKGEKGTSKLLDEILSLITPRGVEIPETGAIEIFWSEDRHISLAPVYGNRHELAAAGIEAPETSGENRQILVVTSGENSKPAGVFAELDSAGNLVSYEPLESQGEHTTRNLRIILENGSSSGFGESGFWSKSSSKSPIRTTSIPLTKAFGLD